MKVLKKKKKKRFFSPLLRAPAKKSVSPLVEGSNLVAGMFWVFVGNCFIKRFSQRPITTPFYAKSCGCRCLNHQHFNAKLSVLCLALSNTEPQGSAIVLLLVWLSDSVLAVGNAKSWVVLFRGSNGH